MRANNRAWNSDLVIRQNERKQQSFKSHCSNQHFLATLGSIYNIFNMQSHLVRLSTLHQLRATTHFEWAVTTAAA